MAILGAMVMIFPIVIVSVLAWVCFRAGRYARWMGW
jgi:hypothetical protein